MYVCNNGETVPREEDSRKRVLIRIVFIDLMSTPGTFSRGFTSGSLSSIRVKY